MILRICAALSFLALLGLAPLSVAEHYSIGEFAKVPILSVRPMQKYFGKKEAEFHMRDIQRKEEEGELKKYKQKKAGQTVIGPDGELYLIDGHHFARALYELEKESMWVEVLEDYSDWTWEDFWQLMLDERYCYIRSPQGRKLKEYADRTAPVELPKTVAGMVDDPFRSLAWLVREAKGYDNLDMPFQEFLWADYFRGEFENRGYSFNTQTPEGWERALKRAMKLARKKAAQKLPGWHGKKGDCAELIEELYEEEP